MTAASGAARLPSGPLILASPADTPESARSGRLRLRDVRRLDRRGVDQTILCGRGDRRRRRGGDPCRNERPCCTAKVAASPGTLLLAADQILEIDGEMLGKPADRAGAAAQLARLQGRAHRLLTAAVMFRDGERIWHHLAEAKLTMRSLDQGEIESYLDLLGDAALWSPGSYQIEALGMHLFSRIEGCHYGILGLPLLEITAFLRGHGLMLSTETG